MFLVTEGNQEQGQDIGYYGNITAFFLIFKK